ncbi:hypothetical protein MA16_Dca006442 [Dendrobium catenatum]|uniref:Uncharacterized protein n=1 Tax=Dendrobium catenatum TaxID=906689 RepID=A0A2I0X7S6_9ASPA|nr:hypothetical protein MA16_Dca006442 [Dendrobium catenatum]
MAPLKKLKKAKRKLKDSSKCGNPSSAPKPPESQQADNDWWYSFWHKNSDSGLSLYDPLRWITQLIKSVAFRILIWIKEATLHKNLLLSHNSTGLLMLDDKDVAHVGASYNNALLLRRDEALSLSCLFE